ncbi:alpha-D-ribose 1-methylphosphonate 5-triphosphate diphosphatase [Marivita cryptomonadis]|uniref:Alpha-D-ribose 1-methylphosphonate 5-triphosphate diphosphatase n=2 Tax=Roseobacteraceae TaxID=2854170 RepID=A0A9Q2RWS4_9RHOB|nr:alpha-D-ribose 1-methylphosphonate 5-triphosphate diphosphatase [Marivita cryptomonadis]MBM2330777.1 alpha-D-ribose 1-methylphosphonate 5-triphosphate diphosphatase [Marivita cryptomonadis]MBM2340363.1 alpha-D-ribose 1-methylphosphonate 5-triphosphate diphosphatase [Marivita cryptomonadis]MBM2345025.1 alpha-D-ribose 1-methylphosphonate 5-triphosphate diphosphatase [Marivita cryptomonadis]MBM2349703.1 alpha-D-ribose 1-methylphosphonate 5-triphosphate diphosphatase [Marivita cryptomonadis]
MSEVLQLANARLVLTDRVITGRIIIIDGEIDVIEEGDTVPNGAVNCQGDYVMPGLVELHTDNLERHIEPRPKVDWPHLPALLAHDAELASTGITTVFDALRVGSIHSAKTGYGEYARKLADELLEARKLGLFKISHFLHLRAEICSETLLEEMAAFGPEDRVGIVSLMDHTPGQRQFRDLSALKNYVTKKRGLNDIEFAEHVANLRMLQEKFGAIHETGAVAEARRYGAVLASHDDTTADQVDTSAANGVGFAEFPTTREAAAACRAHGIAVMMGAPNLVRGGSHSGNVAARELAEAEMLNIISSDYVPSALLLSAFLLADIWDNLPAAIACVTNAPAASAGLTDRGRLQPGLRGDVIRVRAVGSTPLIRGVWSRGRRVA